MSRRWCRPCSRWCATAAASLRANPSGCRQRGVHESAPARVGRQVQGRRAALSRVAVRRRRTERLPRPRARLRRAGVDGLAARAARYAAAPASGGRDLSRRPASIAPESGPRAGASRRLRCLDQGVARRRDALSRVREDPDSGAIARRSPTAWSSRANARSGRSAVSRARSRRFERPPATGSNRRAPGARRSPSRRSWIRRRRTR